MKIDGVVGAPVRRVDLDRFFDQRTWVDIKVISPYGRALVREILMEGFTVGDLDQKGKVTDVRSNPKGQADREMRVREVKLRHSFAGTNITVDGQPPEWGPLLWAGLDEANPRILDEVIAAVDDWSKLAGGDEDGGPPGPT